MCRICQCVVLVVAIGASPRCMEQASTQSSPVPAADLERLTVPAAALPANCQLRPVAQDGPFRTNPAVVTDPRILQFIHMWVFGARDAARPENAAIQAEAGYAANYREQGGSPEIGVYAIRIKNPPAPLPPRGMPNQVRLVKGSVVIFYWSDSRADAPDLGCFDVVRRHIEAVDLR